MLLPWINNKRGRILFASSSTLYGSSQVDFSLAGRRYIVDGLTHYAHSKRLVALLTRCLQDHLDKYHVNIKTFCEYKYTIHVDMILMVVNSIRLSSWGRSNQALCTYHTIHITMVQSHIRFHHAHAQ